MSEKADWKYFRDKMKFPRDRWDRIENGVGVGMPDTNYCVNGHEGWLEFKSPLEPKRPGTPLFGSNHNLSQDQKNWFNRQITAGGRAYIFIATDKRMMLIHGRYADAINELTVEELVEASEWIAAKPVKDSIVWHNLREVLSR